VGEIPYQEGKNPESLRFLTRNNTGGGQKKAKKKNKVMVMGGP